MLRVRVKPFSMTKAEFRTREKGVIFIDCIADLKLLRQTTLVEMFNALTGFNIKNFGSRAQAERCTAAEINDYIAHKPSKETPVAKKKDAQAGGTATADAPKTAEAVAAPKDELSPEQRAEKVKTLEADLAEAKDRYNKYVTDKKAELKALKSGGPKADREPSDVIKKVVALLERKEGATKQQLMDETGAKAGYVGALISRILPAKGYGLRSQAIEGQRVKTYHIDRRQS